jgi:hypothetical protein
MTELNPATFDLDAWATDANLPEESADVYKRADVIGELSALQRKIAIRRDAAKGEKTATGDKELAAMERRHTELVETFTGSKLTVFVRALTSDEMEDLRAAHEERTKGMEPKRANKEFGFDLLAAAIISVQPAGEERYDVRWDTHMIKRLEKAIGPAQMTEILNARQYAQNAVPTVDADFLLRSSGSDAGAE